MIHPYVGTLLVMIVVLAVMGPVVYWLDRRAKHRINAAEAHRATLMLRDGKVRVSSLAVLRLVETGVMPDGVDIIVEEDGVCYRFDRAEDVIYAAANPTTDDEVDR